MAIQGRRPNRPDAMFYRESRKTGHARAWRRRAVRRGLAVLVVAAVVIAIVMWVTQ